MTQVLNTQAVDSTAWTATPPGDRFSIEVTDDRLRELVVDLWGQVETRPRAPETNDPVFRLAVTPGPAPPEPADSLESWQGELPVFRVSADAFLHARVDLDRPTVVGWTTSGLLESAPATVSRLLLEAPAAVLLAARGWQAIHAATITGPAGAVVLRGPSGAGKSTLAAAAELRGMTVLGDESVLVKRAGCDQVAASVREILLGQEMAGMLDVDGPSKVGTNGEVKVRVPMRTCRSSNRVAQHAATVILGDLTGSSEAHLEPLEAESMITEFRRGEVPQESWFTSPEVVTRAWARRPMYRLTGHTDLNGAMNLLQALTSGESF